MGSCLRERQAVQEEEGTVQDCSRIHGEQDRRVEPVS